MLCGQTPAMKNGCRFHPRLGDDCRRGCAVSAGRELARRPWPRTRTKRRGTPLWVTARTSRAGVARRRAPLLRQLARSNIPNGQYYGVATSILLLRPTHRRAGAGDRRDHLSNFPGPPSASQPAASQINAGVISRPAREVKRNAGGSGTAGKECPWVEGCQTNPRPPAHKH